MIVFPPAKINLGLSVVSKRADGFHNLESVFYPLPLTDILEVVPSKNLGLNLQLKGMDVAGDIENNLVYKAYQLISQKYQIPGVDAVLFKHIPMGAGLGGGSADGAYMIRALTELFALHLSIDEAKELSAQLGSDCPFFIESKPSFVSGRGEIMEESDVNLSGLFLVLVHPGIHVSTPWAYSKIVPKPAAYNLKELSALPLEQWQGVVINDFETPVFEEFPDIRKVRDVLTDHGAVYASMSGSGSSCYGLFREEKELRSLFPGMFTWSGWL
ncbi:MAG: hypothetical protein RL220_1225 [Bacteroidota bacterium]